MIYLDNAATTKISKKSQEARDYAENTYFANSSGLHSFAMKSEELINESKKIIANAINASPNEIYFTKGATEANNIAISSFANESNTALTTQIEHSSVNESFLNYKFKEVLFVKNDKNGFIDLDDLKILLANKVDFISIIHVNNELGSIQDIKNISSIVKKSNPQAIIHIDSTQALGKIPCDVRDLGVDMLTFSAHKFHGPKGVGGLYVKKDVIGKVHPLLVGGYQQKISSGTDNHPAIYAMGIALDEKIKADEYSYIDEINQYFRKLLKKNIDDIIINTPDKSYSPYILSVGFKNIKAEVLVHMLEDNEIYVSSGSACSKGPNNRILKAIGLDKDYMDGVIRFSFSSETSKDDLEEAVEIVSQSVQMIRKVML